MDVAFSKGMILYLMLNLLSPSYLITMQESNIDKRLHFRCQAKTEDRLLWKGVYKAESGSHALAQIDEY